MFLPTMPNSQNCNIHTMAAIKTEQRTPFSTERNQKRKFGENKFIECMHLIIENGSRWS